MQQSPLAAFAPDPFAGRVALVTGGGREIALPFARSGTARAEDADYERQALSDIPSHRLGGPQEVAALCAFLCSPAARYVNGAQLIADGGYYLDRWTPMLDPEG